MTFGEGNGRARRKQLSVVFTEAMSRVASRANKACLAKLCDTKADGANKSHLRNQRNSEHRLVYRVFSFFGCRILWDFEPHELRSMTERTSAKRRASRGLCLPLQRQHTALFVVSARRIADNPFLKSRLLTSTHSNTLHWNVQSLKMQFYHTHRRLPHHVWKTACFFYYCKKEDQY